MNGKFGTISIFIFAIWPCSNCTVWFGKVVDSLY